MHIICPNCGTSYAVKPAALGSGGRTVRCARCKETWHATAADLVDEPVAAAVGDMSSPVPVERRASAPPPDRRPEPAEHAMAAAPHIDSPSIVAEDSFDIQPDPDGHIRLSSMRKRKTGVFTGDATHLPSRSLTLPVIGTIRLPGVTLPHVNLTHAVTILSGVLLALVLLRSEVVRLMPQTAAFFHAFGLGTNLRGLEFVDVKSSTETVDGKTVLLIEGAVRRIDRGAAEVPRLRFILRDEAGTEIYAWNATTEQRELQTGERAAFVARLAAPPPAARELVVRFLNRRDLSSGRG